MNGIARRVFALAAATVITLGGAAMSTAAAAEPGTDSSSSSSSAPRAVRGTPGTESVGAMATYIPNAVGALGTADDEIFRSCPSTSCAQTGGVWQNIAVVDVCYLTINGVEWDLVFRPATGAAGWIPNAHLHIYNQGGGGLTANECAGDPNL